MFASLPPGATLVRHRDPYAGSLRYHIGLVTPNDPKCYPSAIFNTTFQFKNGLKMIRLVKGTLK